MGIRRSKMTFLRLASYRVSAWSFRVFEGSLTSRNMEDRTAGNERERDRVREKVDYRDSTGGTRETRREKPDDRE